MDPFQSRSFSLTQKCAAVLNSVKIWTGRPLSPYRAIWTHFRPNPFLLIKQCLVLGLGLDQCGRQAGGVGRADRLKQFSLFCCLSKLQPLTRYGEWNQLPHKLCCLAYFEEPVARQHLTACHQMWTSRDPRRAQHGLESLLFDPKCPNGLWYAPGSPWKDVGKKK